MAKTVRLEGGPRHGQVVKVDGNALHVAVAVRFPYTSIKTAVYVPHPSDPDNVFVIDRRQSHPGIDLEPRHAVRVDVCGGPEVSIFGYKAALPASGWDGLVDQIRDILLRHYIATGQNPDSITFPIRFERG